MQTLLEASPKGALYPSALRRSKLYQLRINGEYVEAFHALKADFAVFDCFEPLQVEIETAFDPEEYAIRPLAREIPHSLDARIIRLRIDHPQNLCLDVPGQKPLFLYANGPETDKPSPTDPSVRYFAAGKIHEVGQLELKSGETLYIEAGAVVRGCIRSSRCSDITICGRGILDGSCYSFENKELVRSIVFDNCQDIKIRDIIMIESTSWMLVLGNCQGAHIRNLRQIGSVMSTDGIDICGSSNVLIEHCCLRNDDDNIAIKAVKCPEFKSWYGNVENILVRHCVFWNGTPGNVMEIGYELCGDHVRDIAFEDIDVIAAEGEGAVFSIHNGDRACVENIRWENIRVEHYWDKLVDLRVVHARYNKDLKRGRIRNILLKDIRVRKSIYNQGCSISLLSGFRAAEPIQDVVFENFCLNDQRVTGADDLDLHCRNVEAVHYR